MKKSQADHWREMLPEILQIAGIGTWEMLVSSKGDAGGRMWFSSSVRDLFGYTEGELGGEWELFLKQVCHPDYHETIRATIMNAVQRPGETFHSEFLVWSKRAESWRWVYIFGKAELAETPGSATVLGGIQDIHDRRAKQKQLEREQLEALQTIELQKAVLEQQIHERTTLLRDVQARVDSILGATSSLPAPGSTDDHVADTPHPRARRQSGDVYDEVDVLFAEGLHKAFDVITQQMAWYKAVIDSIPFPISVTDMASRWMYLNAPGLAAAGARSLEEIYGLPAASWSEQGETTGQDEKGHTLFSLHHQAHNKFFQGQASSLLDSSGSTIGHIETMQDVTEVHKADERTRLMLDAMPLGCNFWDKDCNNIDCNKAVVSLFDLPDKASYLKEFTNLAPEFQPCGGRSADLAREHVQCAFTTGYDRFEWMHRKLSGELIPAEITLVRINWRGEYVVVGYTSDLRELKAARSELDRERLLLKEVLDSSPVCMAIVVRDKIRFVTSYTRAFLGAEPGDNINDFHASRAEAVALARELREKRRLNWRPVSLKSASNGVRDMLANAFYTEYYGEEGLVLWLMDITAIREKERELLLARDAAEESTRAKSEFLANMSHEIRTPMNAILGMTHLILRTQLTEKQRDYMEKTDQSGKALLRIINDILDFSKIEAGKLDMEQVPFSIADVVREVAAIESEAAQKKGLALDIALPENLPETALGDPLRLRQVFINLMSNAIKFTSHGGVKLGVIVVDTGERTVTLEFSLADTGIGMSQTHIARLFSPFTQADTSTTRQYGGTGLGLAISRRLVELMGGAIWCESVQGEGSTFRFTATFGLPEAVTPASPRGNAEHAENAQSSQPAQLAQLAGRLDAETLITALKPVCGAKLLLVEDNLINQMVAEELLEIAGFRVDIAANGEEALDRVAANEYALVLMDIQMPVMDGFTAARAIRDDPRNAALPIIAMTALAMQGDKEKSLEAGMNDHVTKPIDAAELYATLAKWLLRDNTGRE
ncbi:MAG: Sensor histidine kinase RcsC [Desulfovibrio sp.]